MQITRANLKKLRADIIDKALDLENTIDVIITNRYLKKNDHNFMTEVLGNEYTNNGFRISIFQIILEKIHYCTKKEINILIKKIHRLFKIRNIFAHSKANKTKNILYDKYFATDSRNKEINFIELEKEFNQLKVDVLSYIDNLVKKMTASPIIRKSTTRLDDGKTIIDLTLQ